MQHMAKNVVKVNEGLTKYVVGLGHLLLSWLGLSGPLLNLLCLQAVKKKYSSSRLMKISLLPQLKSTLMKDLAAPLLPSS